MKDTCSAQVESGQTLSEYQAKLLSQSLNDTDTNQNSYSM